MKRFLLLLTIILTGFTLKAQNMINATYNEVRTNYMETKGLIQWEETTTSVGIFRVSYKHKDSDYEMYCFFDKPKGIVTKYMIIDTSDKANVYVKAFNEDFVTISRNEWIDYGSNCTWAISVDGNNLYLEAFPIEKN